MGVFLEYGVVTASWLPRKQCSFPSSWTSFGFMSSSCREFLWKNELFNGFWANFLVFDVNYWMKLS